MKRTFWYAAMIKDEAQHSRMSFYEAVQFKEFVLNQGDGVVITQPSVFVKIDDIIRTKLRPIFFLTFHIPSHNIGTNCLKAITAKDCSDDKKNG